MKIISQEKKDFDPNEQSGFSSILPKNVYNQLLEMNNSKRDIDAWSKRNVITVLLVILIFTIPAIFIDWKLILISTFIAGFFYYKQLSIVTIVYQQFRFERQMQFSKFARLITPLLKQSKGGINLWSIFSRLVPRLSHDVDKKILQRLMLDMSNYPDDYYPFEVFANQMSGSDNSHLFMSTLADLDMGSVDLQVIDRLSKMASEEMIAGIDQIIAFKLGKFSSTFFKMVGVIMIIVFGFSVSVVVYKIGEIGVFM